MRNRRHLTHYLIACAVAVGSVGLASVAAGPADAASPNDFLCYVAGSSQVAAVGTAYINALQVELSSTACTSPTPDAAAGLTVSYSVLTTAGGPSVTFTPSSLVTASNGSASVTSSANGVAGAFTVVATSAATTSNPAPQSVTFSLTNAGLGPASITAGLGAVQSASVGSAFTLGLAVTVDDAFNNPVANAPVTFLAPTSGASGTFSTSALYAVTVLTDAAGIAVAPAFVANEVPGGYVVRASVAGYAPSAAFALVNESTTSFVTTSASPSSLAQGATRENITITGSGFASGAVVTFSNAGISVSSSSFVSATSIVATIAVARGSSTGPGNVTVTNPGGMSTTAIAAFSVLSATKPSALLLGFAKGSAALSRGEEGQLRAYASELVGGATLHLVAYAQDNVTLAKSRATNVARYVTSIVHGLHVSLTEVTTRASNAVRVTS